MDRSYVSRAARAARFVYRRLSRTRKIIIDGIRLRIPADTPPYLRILMYWEQYEDAETVFLKEILRPDDVVVEAGAAIGFVGLLCARIVGPENVVLIEANSDMIAEIEHNFKTNDVPLPDVRHGLATAEESAPQTFHIADHFWSSSIADRGMTIRTDTVATVGLNALFREKNATVFVCDIEGGEYSLFEDIDLSGLRLIVVETHDRIFGKGGAARLEERVLAQGFELKELVGKNVHTYERALSAAAA